MVKSGYCDYCKKLFVVIVGKNEVALCPKCATPLQNKGGK